MFVDSLMSLFLLAQRQSMLSWTFTSLGWFYALVLPLSGLLVFVGAILVVAMSRRPSVIAAYLVFLPIPLIIGIWGTLTGVISGYSIIAHSTATPSMSEVGRAWSTALFSSLAGLLVTIPAYLVVAIGLFLRTLYSGHSQK